ncbi:hypothetical protein KKD49_06460 [Myxococcota bacterium]|nr:hypothetical protein [Myxococcota bacterium]
MTPSSIARGERCKASEPLDNRTTKRSHEMAAKTSPRKKTKKKCNRGETTAIIKSPRKMVSAG